MTIIEQPARALAARLHMRFEGSGPEPAVFFGYLPAEPTKAICVYANDLRAPGDLDGVRVQVVIRSDTDGAWPLEMAMRIVKYLDDRRDTLFVADGQYINRVETEKGFEFAGFNANNTQLYTANFRIYACGC